MWKFFSRGVREAVERNWNIGRTTTTEVRVQKENPQVNNYCQRLAPYVHERWKHCGSSQAEHESQKKDHSSTFRHTWFGAFSCSGALAIGWMLTQPYLWRKWIRHPECQRRERRQCFFNLFSTAWTQPIIPGAVAQINFCNEVDITPDGPAPFYGPKTAEEALDEAADDFRNVHNSILAEIENKRAVDLIKRKKNREALELFVSASHRGNGPAAYNLAQCFELGLGIKQNFHEAARWYQTAVDRGHLTAMYNLGVFYAHGWGGLKPDAKKARQLFQEAAKRGQPDAKAALGIADASAEIAPEPVDSVKQDSWNENADEFSSNFSDVINNADAIFKLASSFETSVDPDPITGQLMLQLYKIASDMGHAEARTRANILQVLASGDNEDVTSLHQKRDGDFTVSNLAFSF